MSFPEAIRGFVQTDVLKIRFDYNSISDINHGSIQVEEFVHVGDKCYMYSSYLRVF